MGLMFDQKIKTYAINLDHRHERRDHIIGEFAAKNEFDFRVYPAIKNKRGNVGLWQTIREIIADEFFELTSEFVIVCEDDHEFTSQYSMSFLHQILSDARDLEADLILGGVSWFHSAVQARNNLFWVDTFNGFQFAIVFKSIYKAILDFEYNNSVHADFTISRLTDKKFCIFPFISIQREFGYSDITRKNAISNHLKEIFDKTFAVLENLQIIRQIYGFFCQSKVKDEINDYSNMVLQISVIAEEKNNDLVVKQFFGRREFDVSYHVLSETEGNLEIELWSILTRRINRALEEEEDFIIVSNGHLKFSDNYFSSNLINGIIKAHALGAKILTGISEGEDQICYLGGDIYWVNSISSTNFLVVFKDFFHDMLMYDFQNSDVVSDVLSNLTANKFALFPFIIEHIPNVATINKRFYDDPALRFAKIKAVTLKYADSCE